MQCHLDCHGIPDRPPAQRASWLPPGVAGTAAAVAAAGGEEASRAEAAAQAARQWETLLHDSWQELQREEEAALRAAGHEADAPEEGEAGDDDADDVSAEWANDALAGLGIGSWNVAWAAVGASQRRAVAGLVAAGTPCCELSRAGNAPLPRHRRTLAPDAPRPWSPAPRQTTRRSCGAGGGEGAAGAACSPHTACMRLPAGCGSPSHRGQPPRGLDGDGSVKRGCQRLGHCRCLNTCLASAQHAACSSSRSRAAALRSAFRRGGRGRAQRAFRRRAEEAEQEAADLDEEQARKRRRTRE